ncbi:MAG: MAPEG family protein [Alphaproteobacteria bacterium]|nr:MAPEG family protein [Alphaproteobacteria bacterium]
MTVDLKMLVWTAVLCLVLFLPYVLCRIFVWGLVPTVGYPTNPPPLPLWAQRAQRAHLNLVENIGPFAVLVLVAQMTGAANATTALGATLFFWARIVQAVVHIFGIPWLRTAAFGVSIVGMVMILAQILAR